MPIYAFINPNNPSEVKDILMGMNDTHEYFQDGVKWDRVWTKPQMATDTVVNEESAADFVTKTGNKRGNLGNLHDLSAELSNKRAKRYGKDPLKEKHYADYKKKTGKMSHNEIVEKSKDRVIEI